MKLAIFLIGHFRRTFKYKQLLKFLKLCLTYNKFICCDIFIYTWNKYEASCGNLITKCPDGKKIDHLANFKYNATLQNRELKMNEITNYFNKFDIKEIKLYEQSEDLLVGNKELYCGAKYMYWLNNEAGTSFSEYCKINNKQYDIIFRMRPDIHKFIGFYQRYKVKRYLNAIYKTNYTNTILGILYQLGMAVGDSFYCMTPDNYIRLQRYILENIEELKSNNFAPVEFILGRAIIKMNIDKKCTDPLFVSLFYKILFGIQWFSKN
jgi:hypothetical protein